MTASSIPPPPYPPLRDLGCGDCLFCVEAGHTALSSLALSHDGCLMAVGHDSGAIALWQVAGAWWL